MWAAGAVAAVFPAAFPPAVAATIVSNYTFPDGTAGFDLDSNSHSADGSVMPGPGLLVSFNPQPDPPGTPPTALTLDNPMLPVLSNPAAEPGYSFVFSFLGAGLPSIFPPSPCAPDANTGECNASFGFTRTTDGVTHDFQVMLSLSGPVDSAT